MPKNAMQWNEPYKQVKIEIERFSNTMIWCSLRETYYYLIVTKKIN